MFLHACIVGLLACCAGCGAFGVGSETGVIPDAASIESPSNKCLVGGRIVWRKAAAIFRARGVRVVLAGERGVHDAVPDVQGAFDFGRVYAGDDYVLSVSFGGGGRSWSLPLPREGSVHVEVEVCGPDMLDFDCDGITSGEPACRLNMEVSSPDFRFQRVVEADGSVRTILPDGGEESFVRPVVRRRSPSGAVTYRLDTDYDGGVDAEDADDDGDGVPDSRDPDADGDGRWDSVEYGAASSRPLDFGSWLDRAASRGIATAFFEDVSFAMLGSSGGGRGDLACEGTSGGFVAVRLRLVRLCGTLRIFCRKVRMDGTYDDVPMLDDGSAVDLDTRQPGLQASCDRVEDDGEYACIVPVHPADLRGGGVVLLHPFAVSSEGGALPGAPAVWVSGRVPAAEPAASSGARLPRLEASLWDESGDPLRRLRYPVAGMKVRVRARTRGCGEVILYAPPFEDGKWKLSSTGTSGDGSVWWETELTLGCDGVHVLVGFGSLLRWCCFPVLKK